MVDDAITAGEATDFRLRMGALERRMAEAENKTSVHEQRCASRYLQIMFLLSVSIGINLPGAFPHLLTILGMAK